MNNRVPKELQAQLKDLKNSNDQLKKIFFINVGPKISTYEDLKSVSETQKWYLMSSIDRYLSSIADKKALSEIDILQKKYRFPVSVMNNFPRYNPSVTVGWNVNTYGLDTNKFDEIIIKKIEKGTIQRNKFLEALNRKGIQLQTPKSVSVDKMVKDVNMMLNDTMKKEIQALYDASNGKPDPKAVLRIVGKNMSKN
jgi:hypothetical protein